MTVLLLAAALAVLLVALVVWNEVRIWRRMNRPTIYVEIRADASSAAAALERAAKSTERLGRLGQ